MRSPKTILILGGFGFIGTNVIKFIEDNFNEDYKVVVFDKLPCHPHGVVFKNIQKVYDGDFADELMLERIFVENKIDIVLHLISSTVPVTSRNAKYDVSSNLLPTLSLLSIMEYHRVKDIIYFSSGGAIYGEHSNFHSETDAVFPKSSYAIVKHSIERYLLLYSELFGFNSLILRLSNPFGGYHYSNYQGICNIAIRKGLKKEKIQIWGDGNGRKDYISISDVCDILFRLINAGIYTDTLNVGSGKVYSVNEILEIVKEELSDLTVEYIGKSENDVSGFSLNIDKLREAIGDYQFTELKVGICETMKWESSFL
jgi:UDP-glucose 4-epimerase